MAISESGRQRAKTLLTAVRERDAATLQQGKAVFCTVVSVGSTTVTVKTGADSSGGHSIARMFGPRPRPGDRGVLIPVDGSSFFVPVEDFSWELSNLLIEMPRPSAIVSPYEGVAPWNGSYLPTITGTPDLLDDATSGSPWGTGWDLGTGDSVGLGTGFGSYPGVASGTIAIRFTHKADPNAAAGYLLNMGTWQGEFLGILRQGDQIGVYMHSAAGDPPSLWSSASSPLTNGGHSVIFQWTTNRQRLLIDGVVVAENNGTPYSPSWSGQTNYTIGSASQPPRLTVNAVVFWQTWITDLQINRVIDMGNRWSWEDLSVDNITMVRPFGAHLANNMQSTTNTSTPVPMFSHAVTLPAGTWDINVVGSITLSRSVNTGEAVAYLRMQPGNVSSSMTVNVANYATITAPQSVTLPLRTRVYPSIATEYTFTIEFVGASTAGTTYGRGAMLSGWAVR